MISDLSSSVSFKVPQIVGLPFNFVFSLSSVGIPTGYVLDGQEIGVPSSLLFSRAPRLALLSIQPIQFVPRHNSTGVELQGREAAFALHLVPRVRIRESMCKSRWRNGKLIKHMDNFISTSETILRSKYSGCVRTY